MQKRLMQKEKNGANGPSTQDNRFQTKNELQGTCPHLHDRGHHRPVHDHRKKYYKSEIV